MKKFKISFEAIVPDNITFGMMSIKYDEETIQRELYEHLDGEIQDDLGDEDGEAIKVENISIFEEDWDC